MLRRHELESKRTSVPVSADQASVPDAPGEWPELETIPVRSPSACDSDAVIELPLSLRVVPGPEAAAFCGFLDDDTVIALPEAELAPDAMHVVNENAESPRPSGVRRYDTVLPPPPATDDDVILPSREH